MQADEGGGVRLKRQKTSSNGTNPSDNPYLAHLYPSQNGSPLEGFRRHATTAAEATIAENGPYNPFTSEKLSSEYFTILKTRRDLPVHVQRLAGSVIVSTMYQMLI